MHVENSSSVTLVFGVNSCSWRVASIETAGLALGSSQDLYSVSQSLWPVA